MLVNIPKIGNANLYGYKYDQLNRIKSMDAFTGINNADNSFTAVSGQSYKERVTYDANGNILTYKRNGDNARLSMDEMTYTYKPNTNQLDKVVDIAPDASLIDYNKYRDIKQGQQNGNYQYDAIGNLIADVSEGITNIKWNVYGKIQEINKNGSLISYTYDASGNRISKTADGKTTWYVRDASGNVMSVYTVDATVNSGHLTQSEVNLYGSSRLGIWNANKDIAVTPNTNYFRGNKWFELSNHLGNVLATITDKRLPHTSNNSTIDYYEADISTANDYYLGGMEIKGRKYSQANSNYHYGFNGKEKDNEVLGEANFQDYGFRLYNTRLGRFISIDPLTKQYPWYTPYQFAGNKPIAFVDKDGLEEARPDEKRAAWLRPLHAYIVKENAQKAREASENAGLPDARDGQWDAFRHTYWNALNARDLGEKTSAFFPTLHETGSEANNPSSLEYDPVAVKMDLYNNQIGRKIGAANPNATDEELQIKVMKALNAGELKVIKIDDVKTPTGSTKRIPTNTSGQPIQNNTEKVLTNSSPKPKDSGITKPEKSKLGYDKKSKEYTNPNPMPPK